MSPDRDARQAVEGPIGRASLAVTQVNGTSSLTDEKRNGKFGSRRIFTRWDAAGALI